MSFSALSFLAVLLTATGGLTIASQWQEISSNAISIFNTALITIGSTAILLYQRGEAVKLAVKVATGYEITRSESVDTRALIQQRAPPSQRLCSRFYPFKRNEPHDFGHLLCSRRRQCFWRDQPI